MVASKSKTCCLLAKKVSKLFCTCAATPPDPRGQRSLSSRYITGFKGNGRRRETKFNRRLSWKKDAALAGFAGAGVPAVVQASQAEPLAGVWRSEQLSQPIFHACKV